MAILIVAAFPSRLSRYTDCQSKTAVDDVVRGATVDNPIMCALNAQAMIARTVSCEVTDPNI